MSVSYKHYFTFSTFTGWTDNLFYLALEQPRSNHQRFHSSKIVKYETVYQFSVIARYHSIECGKNKKSMFIGR